MNQKALMVSGGSSELIRFVVWIANGKAVDIAAKHTDPNAAAREIASIARQRWHAETQGN